MEACMWIVAAVAALVILFKLGWWWSARSLADKMAAAGTWSDGFESTAKSVAALAFAIAREQRWRLSVALPIYRHLWDRVSAFQDPEMSAVKFLYFAVMGHRWGSDDIGGFSEDQVVAAAAEVRTADDEEIREALRQA